MPTVIGKDPSVYRTCTCKNCASLIQFLPQEVETKKSVDYTGGVDFSFYIVCPDCKNNVFISLSTLYPRG